MTPATAALTKTEEGQADADLHAQAIRTGTAVIQDAAKLIQSLEGADPEKVKRVNALLTASLAAVRGAEVPSFESRKAALIKEFGIEVIGEGKVRLTLGETSRIDFLRKVQDVATELHGRPAIYSPLLESWATEAAFTAKPKKGEKIKEIGVDGNVANSTGKTRAEQDAEGWNNVDLSDLAVAHTAYFLATGKDLFAGKVVRARDGAFFFDDIGLNVGDSYGDLRCSYVAASAALPPRN